MCYNREIEKYEYDSKNKKCYIYYENNDKLYNNFNNGRFNNSIRNINLFEKKYKLNCTTFDDNCSKKEAFKSCQKINDRYPSNGEFPKCKGVIEKIEGKNLTYGLYNESVNKMNDGVNRIRDHDADVVIGNKFIIVKEDKSTYNNSTYDANRNNILIERNNGKCTEDIECNAGGRCDDGQCSCHVDFVGTNCETHLCDNVECEYGSCNRGVCQCSNGTSVDNKYKSCLKFDINKNINTKLDKIKFYQYKIQEVDIFNNDDDKYPIKVGSRNINKNINDINFYCYSPKPKVKDQINCEGHYEDVETDSKEYNNFLFNIKNSFNIDTDSKNIILQKYVIDTKPSVENDKFKKGIECKDKNKIKIISDNFENIVNKSLIDGSNDLNLDINRIGHDTHIKVNNKILNEYDYNSIDETLFSLNTKINCQLLDETKCNKNIECSWMGSQNKCNNIIKNSTTKSPTI